MYVKILNWTIPINVPISVSQINITSFYPTHLISLVTTMLLVIYIWRSWNWAVIYT